MTIKRFENDVLVSEKKVTKEEYDASHKSRPMGHMLANPLNPKQFLYLIPEEYVEGLSYDEHIKLGKGKLNF